MRPRLRKPLPAGATDDRTHQGKVVERTTTSGHHPIAAVR